MAAFYRTSHHIINFFLLVVLISGCDPDRNNNNLSKPNVIFVMADDLGYADLGCYGQEIINTPNIDKLARSGMKFLQCYSGSPVCAPSRSTLMTGQHTGHTTVRGNRALVNSSDPDGRVPLRKEDITLAEMFKSRGYVTGITGKWGLGEPNTSGVPNQQGYDQWLGYLNQNRAHSYYPGYLWSNENKLMLEDNANGERGTYSHDLFTNFVIDFIESQKDTSFFLYVPYTIPHDAYEIPDMGIYGHQPWSEEEMAYAAMVTRLDRDIGKILKKLDDLNLRENTMLIFCSDNGAALRWEKRFNSSGNLRGKKRDMYEGGIRVPMIMSWPGTIPEGLTSDQVLYFPDMLPTLARLIGADIPIEVDGISVLEQIIDQKEVENNRTLYWEFSEFGFQQALRWNQWKAIRLSPGEELELYHLQDDEGEQVNVASANPEVIKTLESILDTIRTESHYWPSGLTDKQK
jgi:arylsulfatase A-like enzyme